MTGFVLDASLALQWFLEDETNREYSLKVLAGLSQAPATAPALWFYEVGNALVTACRRKRITPQQVDAFLSRLSKLPIEAAAVGSLNMFELPAFALKYNLTNYDAAYLYVAVRLELPLATSDNALRLAAIPAGVSLVEV